jgi:hypothetical protein
VGAWGLVLWLRLRQFPRSFAVMGAVAVGLTLPLFFYNYWLFSANEAFAQWSSQNYLPSPHPIHYILGYILLAIPAYVGGRWAWQRAEIGYPLLISWLLIVPVLVYIPLNVQRRLAESVLIPLAILAVIGLRLIARDKAYRRWRTALLIMVLPSSLLFWLVTLMGVSNPASPAFRPKAELEAWDWLMDHSEADAVVIGTVVTGNYLPIYTDLRPFYAHGPETLYSKQKEAQLKRFYTGAMSTSERQSLFARYHIRYVVYGYSERELSQSPANWTEGLTVIYTADAYTIYEVPSNAAP